MSDTPNGAGDDPDDDPLVQLLTRIESKLDRIDRRLDRLDDRIDLQRSHIHTLADMMLRAYRTMNDLCNHNSQDRLNGALAVVLLQNVSPMIDDAAIKKAAEHALVRMRERGWLSDLLEMEKIFERQGKVREEIDQANTKRRAADQAIEEQDRLAREARLVREREAQARERGRQR